jgi:hypothetical protein
MNDWEKGESRFKLKGKNTCSTRLVISALQGPELACQMHVCIVHTRTVVRGFYLQARIVSRDSPVAVLAMYSITYLEVSVLPLPLSPLESRDVI